MSDVPLHYLTLTELASLLRDRSLSPVEVTTALLERIDSLNGKLGAYARTMPELALEQARKAEQEIAAGDYRGPLHGVPLALKDLCATQETVTGCGSKILAEWEPDYDATVVTRLMAAGAVILGKLTMTEFAGTGYHPEAIAPVNPWGEARWPGLSSSGSGVATAAGLCFGATGTDTGGSIRLPSGACGVVGIKPTYGRVSRHGVFPLCDTLDHVGPMARSVADAAVMLEAMAGRDEQDQTSLTQPVESYGAAVGAGVAGVKVGIDPEYCSSGTDPEVYAALRDAVEVLGSLGAEVREITMPSMQESLAAWMTVFSADALAVHEQWYPERAEDYGPAFRLYLDGGANVSGADYSRAQVTRLALRRGMDAVFGEVDVIACPACALPAQLLDERAVEDALAMPSVAFTAPYNLTGDPSVTLPSGFNGEGLPLSLQLLGRHLDEMLLIRVASAYEQAGEWYRRHPGL